MKQNDLYPFEYNLQYDDATPINLSGATVTLSMWLDGASSATVDAEDCVIIEAEEGTIRYQWKDSETATVGMYKFEFLITFSTGSTVTVPSGDVIWMFIIPSLSVVIP
jgi:hypothetical protein